MRSDEKKVEKKGRYGEFGGQYASETLMNSLIELEEAFLKYKDDKDFLDELNYYHKQYTGRPSLLYYAEKMTRDLGGAKIYLKREDLNHTGAHKINNVIGQMLLAKKMPFGKAHGQEKGDRRDGRRSARSGDSDICRGARHGL